MKGLALTVFTDITAVFYDIFKNEKVMTFQIL